MINIDTINIFLNISLTSNNREKFLDLSKKMKIARLTFTINHQLRTW
jgi:hypothetical protein